MTQDDDHPPARRPERSSGWMRDPRLGAAALCVSLGVSLAALGLAAAPWLTGGGFENRVRAYLVDNPEILDEMLQARQAREQQMSSQAVNDAIAADPGLLAHDPRDPAMGPDAGQAAVTVVQFFDYRCPGCKAVAPAFLALAEANPDVRFVFKEWPILDRGEDTVSSEAARAALAAHAQGRYLPVHQALMAEPGLDAAAIDRVLADNGVNPGAARAVRDSDGVVAHVDDIHRTARGLNLMGTPTFIVNGRAVDGVDPAGLARAIAQARAGG